MDVGVTPKVVGLINRIAELRQAVALIDAQASITGMTLRVEQAPPEEPEPMQPPDEDDEHTGPAGGPPTQEPVIVEQAVSTEGLVYPPQMLDAIRDQEVKFWQEAYDALKAAGLTGAPRPPGPGEKVGLPAQAATSPAPQEPQRRPPPAQEGVGETDEPDEPEATEPPPPAPAQRAAAPARAREPEPPRRSTHHLPKGRR